MAVDEAVVQLERLVGAIEASQAVSSELLGLVRDLRERVEELTEDVAALGTRVGELERQNRNDHSLGVVGRERFRTLDELATVLRAEQADAITEVTARIDGVHERALRALTNLTEGKNHA